MNILITGASLGIGIEVTKLRANQNHTITLIARSKENLEKALMMLAENGHQIIVADLSKKEDVDALKALITNNKYHHKTTCTYMINYKIIIENKI